MMNIDTALMIIDGVREPSKAVCDKNFGKALSVIFKESQAITKSESGTVRLVRAFNTDTFVNFYSDYVRMLSQFETMDYFIKLQKILWNITDTSEDLCYRLVCHKLPSLLFNLLHKPHLRIEDSADKTCCVLVHSCVGILYNILLWISDQRHLYRQLGALDILNSIVTNGISNDASANKELQSCRTICLLLFILLLDKNENKVLQDIDKYMEYILKALQDSLSSKTLCSDTYGFHATELLKGLVNLVSLDVNEEILTKPIKHIEKALDIAVDIKQYCTTVCDIHGNNPDCLAAGALQFLEVLPNSHLYMAVGSSLRARVERFAANTWSKECRLLTKSILWTIADPFAADSCVKSVDHLLQSERKLLPVNAHLFIGCANSTKFLMYKVYNELKKRNYSVLIDDGHDHIDTMAEAIENASGIILGICPEFMRSNRFRQLMYIVYMREIPRFILDLDKTCEVAGCLAFSLAQTTSIPLHDQNSITQAVDQLVEQLGKTGKRRSSTDQDKAPDIPGFPSLTRTSSTSFGMTDVDSEQQKHLDVHSYYCDSQDNAADHAFPPDECRSSPPLTPTSVDQVSLWNCEDVTKWLTKHGLVDYLQFTADWDGPMLTELASLYLSLPDYLSTSLRTDLSMPLLDQLRLNAALVELFQISVSSRLSFKSS